MMMTGASPIFTDSVMVLALNVTSTKLPQMLFRRGKSEGHRIPPLYPQEDASASLNVIPKLWTASCTYVTLVA